MNIEKKYSLQRSSTLHQVIDPEFIILHYTAVSLKSTLDIFLSNKANVSCHFIISKDGCIYEMVPSLDGTCYKAHHAGKSYWELSNAQNKAKKKKIFKDLNQFSIGIELVNWNGNIFPYTHKQYLSLEELIKKLISIYPKLNNKNRIIGHEHIAGFRWKVDPGYLFDWKRLYFSLFSKDRSLHDIQPKLQKSNFLFLEKYFKNMKFDDEKSKKINLILEKPLPFFIKKIWLFLLFYLQFNNE